MSSNSESPVRVIAVIGHDPIIKEACGRLKAVDNAFQEKLTFVKKQVENAFEAKKKESENDLGLIEARLKETGMLQEYNKATHHLCISHETGAIELHENHAHQGGFLIL